MKTRCAQVHRWVSRLTVALWIASLVCAAAVAPLAGTIDGEPITPVPATEALDPAKVALGRKMFHDPRLSRGDRVSCAASMSSRQRAWSWSDRSSEA